MTGAAVALDEQGVGVLLFSLELPRDQLVARILSDLAYRPRGTITFGRIMRGARRWLERISGAALIGLGVRLALERR